MLRKKIHTAVALALAATVIGGCGASDQDSGTGGGGGGGGAAVNGIVADGYIARSLVYFDQNNNNQLDANENRALTDNDGYFSIGKDGTDYCAADATDEQKYYCLKEPAFYEGALLLKAVGGYDTATSELFYGTLSREITDTNDTIFVSPIGSLLAKLDDADQATFASTEGIAIEDLLSTDFLDLDAGANTDLISLALTIQRVTDVIGHAIESNYDSSFGEADQATDATDYIYTAIAAELHTTYINNPSDIAARQLGTVLTDTTAVERIVDAVETAIDSGDTASNRSKASVHYDYSWLYPTIVRIPPFISVVIDVAPIIDIDALLGRFRAIDIAIEPMRLPTYDPESEEAIVATETLINDPTYFERLADDATDLTEVKKDIASGAVTTMEDIPASTRESFDDILDVDTAGDKYICFEDAESEYRTDGNKNSVKFTFAGVSDGGGAVTLDVDYVGESEEESLKKLVDGTWSLQNKYTMLLNVDVGGSTKAVIMKPTNDNTGYQFNFGGEVREWDTIDCNAM